MAYEGKHKPIEAPSLRRDPPAYVKLAVLGRWDEEIEKHGGELAKVPNRVKEDLEAK